MIRRLERTVRSWIDRANSRFPVRSRSPLRARVRRRATDLRVAGLESLEARWVPAAPSPVEQEMLEWVNRLRMDPAGEFQRLVSNVSPIQSPIPQVASALRFFNVDLGVARAQFDQLVPAPPLAWSSALNDSARVHNALMIQHDTQSHDLPGQPGLIQRVVNAGYLNPSTVAENVAAYTHSMAYGHAALVIDWGYGPHGIQSPPGHRNALMSPNYREIGVSIVPQTDPNKQLGPVVITQHLASSWNAADPHLLGVVIQDLNGNRFYNVGEGRAGVRVRAEGAAGAFETTTWESGGYQMRVPPGSYTVTFSGGGMTGVVVKTVTVEPGVNAKLDARFDEATAPPPPPPPPPAPRPGVFRFALAQQTFLETAGAVQIVVQRVDGSDGAVSVAYALAGGTAVPGLDFAPIGGVLAFAPGETSKTIPLTILADDLDEPLEHLVLALSNPSGGASLGSPSQTTIHIANATSPPAPPPPSPDPAPTRIESLRRVARRGAPPRFELVFTAEVDAAAVANLAAYTLVHPGRDRRFDTADDRLILFRSAVYDAAARRVTLVPAVRNLAGPLMFHADGDLLLDLLGRPIDAAGDNRPGGRFSRRV